MFEADSAGSVLYRKTRLYRGGNRLATREQVRALLGEGLDYAAAGRRLGIPAGQAYLIATGVPADGSDTVTDREMADRDDLLPAARRRNVEPPDIEDPDGTHDAITVLGRQHNQVRYLLKQLQALPSHTTGGSGRGRRSVRRRRHRSPSAARTSRQCRRVARSVRPARHRPVARTPAARAAGNEFLRFALVHSSVNPAQVH